MAMSVSSAAASPEVRTYVSENLEHPAFEDLKIITRRATGGTVVTVVSPDVDRPRVIEL